MQEQQLQKIVIAWDQVSEQTLSPSWSELESSRLCFIGPSTAFAGNPHLPRPHTTIVLKTP